MWDTALCSFLEVDVSDVRTASIIRETLASETSVYFNETKRRYITQGSHFHTRRRENLKFHF
jgi:hypothetical protein